MSLTKRLFATAGLATLLALSPSASKAEKTAAAPERWEVPEWQNLNELSDQMSWTLRYCWTNLQHINYKHVYLRTQFVPGTNRALEVRSLEATVPKGYGLEKLAIDFSKVISSDYIDFDLLVGLGITEDSQYWQGFNVDWHDIWEQNPQIGSDPNKVPEGMKLKYVTPMIPIRGPLTFPR